MIYNGDSGEPLYVGESKNVYQRLYDHHNRQNTGSDTVRERVEEDEGLNKNTEEGEMWEWTEWAWVRVTEFDSTFPRFTFVNISIQSKDY